MYGPFDIFFFEGPLLIKDAPFIGLRCSGAVWQARTQMWRGYWWSITRALASPPCGEGAEHRLAGGLVSLGPRKPVCGPGLGPDIFALLVRSRCRCGDSPIAIHTGSLLSDSPLVLGRFELEATGSQEHWATTAPLNLRCRMRATTILRIRLTSANQLTSCSTLFSMLEDELLGSLSICTSFVRVARVLWPAGCRQHRMHHIGATAWLAIRQRKTHLRFLPLTLKNIDLDQGLSMQLHR